MFVSVCVGGSSVPRHRGHAGSARLPAGRDAESSSGSRSSAAGRGGRGGRRGAGRPDAGRAVPRGGRRRGTAARARPALRSRLPPHPRRLRARILLGVVSAAPAAACRRPGGL